MKESKEALHLKLAAQIAKYVQIEEVRLTQMAAHLNPKLSGADAGTLILKQTHDEKYRLAGGDLVIKARFHLQAVRKDDNSTKLFDLTAAFDLLYRLEKETQFTVASLRAFAHVNGLYNAWPYWREYVQNTAARMGLPKLVVPVFRVPRSSRDKSPKDGEHTTPPPVAQGPQAAPAATPSNT